MAHRERLVFFSDAVVAIAITLLVLAAVDLGEHAVTIVFLPSPTEMVAQIGSEAAVSALYIGTILVARSPWSCSP